ncbi:hypothetical protein LCGC14_1022900 [marine sediment metagenome]|uniref:Uncharacterized protein n=1 Tax=marine sediment metagenome TaxID=412755 RepID=A0A0F9QF39_9ZZZZ
MREKLAKSPLFTALLKVGKDALEGDLRQRLGEVRETPLGAMVQSALARKQALEAEGREPTEDDVLAWLEHCRKIVGTDEIVGGDE